MNTKTRIITAAAAAALLLGTASAQPSEATTPVGPDGMRASHGMHGPRMPGGGFGGAGGPHGGPGMFGGGQAGVHGGLGMLRGALPFGVPIGTEIQVSFYDSEPAEGVEPTTTVALTVGEDSEAAFRDAIAEAREDAAYMVVEIGEQTRAIDLPDAQVDGGTTPLRGRPGMALGVLNRIGLENGDTVTAVFYDGDPEAGANELETLTFTYGEDSAIGFQEDLMEAGETADWVVVTLPSRTHTVDLSERPARDGMRPDAGRFGPGSFGPGPFGPRSR